MITEEQVLHVAKLARVELTDAEVKSLTEDLSEVLDYAKRLGEIDTEGVPGTSQVTGLINVLDDDEVVDYGATPEELLACSELTVDSNQIRVKKTI